MVNLVTVLLAVIFFVPIAAGMLHPFSGSFRRSLFSLLGRVEQLLGILLSLLLSAFVFSHGDSASFDKLYEAVPSLRAAVVGRDIWAVLLVTALFLFLIPAVLRLLTVPLYRFLSRPADRAAEWMNSLKGGLRRLWGGLWNLPVAAVLVITFALLLSFFVSYDKNTQLGEYINASAAYRMISETVLEPVLGSELGQTVPTFLNSSLEQAVENTSLDKLHGLIYINGVRLEDAVASNEEIDRTARDLTADASSAREKAALLYVWICQNITYDEDKAEAILTSSESVPSGAVTAFSTGRGICFDYACLYVAMCRASGLEVRLVAGQALSDGVWLEHSWNQVWLPDEGKWLNVDATFGSTSGDYFANADFLSDHSGGAVLGEW